MEFGRYTCEVCGCGNEIDADETPEWNCRICSSTNVCGPSPEDLNEMVCCDGGGEVGLGCNHDHCTGPVTKYVMITREEHELFSKLTKVWYHSADTGGFFICGESGTHDERGLPEKILVCPANGLDESVIYTKEKSK